MERKAKLKFVNQTAKQMQTESKIIVANAKAKQMNGRANQNPMLSNLI